MLLGLHVTELFDSLKLQDFEITDEFYDYDMLLSISLLRRGLDGDIKAIQYIDECIGRNPLLELRRQEVRLKQRSLKRESEQQ